ncbi:hypothetical protein [Saccharospirillum sp.]|uniref:hypothetical protein n=1 Tax=Saccharospirillum sp. TaxID=2033801 RepID=UPI0034A00242
MTWWVVLTDLDGTLLDHDSYDWRLVQALQAINIPIIAVTSKTAARNVMTAGQEFLENPMATPFMPSWSRVQSAIPDILEQVFDAVELDNQEMG